MANRRHRAAMMPVRHFDKRRPRARHKLVHPVTTCAAHGILTDVELRQFNLQKMARVPVTESAFIREMLGFDVRRPGAPKGPRKKKARSSQAVKPRATKKKRRGQPRAVESRALRLPGLKK